MHACMHACIKRLTSGGTGFGASQNLRVCSTNVRAAVRRRLPSASLPLNALLSINHKPQTLNPKAKQQRYICPYLHISVFALQSVFARKGLGFRVYTCGDDLRNQPQNGRAKVKSKWRPAEAQQLGQKEAADAPVCVRVLTITKHKPQTLNPKPLS